MTSVDAFCKQLGIDGPEYHVTCIGYTLKNRGCRNKVSATSLSLAQDVLDRIARTIRRGREVDDDSLWDLAELLLCKRNHQRQASETVLRWQARLERTTTSPQRERTRQPVSRTTTPSSPTLAGEVRTSTPQQRTTQSDLRSYSTDQLTSEILTRLGSSMNTQLRAAVADVANAGDRGRTEASEISRTERRVNTSAERRTVTTTDISRTSAANALPTPPATPQRSASPRPQSVRQQPIEVEARVPTHDNVRVTDISTARHQNAVARSIHTMEDIRQARIRALTPTLRLTTPEEPIRPRSPLRTSHTECGICMEPYGDDESDHWECQGCQHRAHADCFESWRTATSTRGVRCMYCRVDVAG